MLPFPEFSDVVMASRRLSGVAIQTPVFTSRTLDGIAGCHVYLKCENFQRVGAFKFRGAYNALSQLTDEQKARGVVTHSSGNHAQAIALAGNLLGIHTVIVMPDNSPKIKLAATKEYGGEIVMYDVEKQTREEISAELSAKHHYTLVPPFDHPHIIAGQGTAAFELFGDVPGLHTLLTPCGGGGLLSGSAIAAKGLHPKTTVIGIEPEMADDATRSFHTKQLQSVKNPPTIADGARTPSLGEYTFPLVLQYVDDMITVSENEIREAVRFLFYRMKLVVEPTGALTIAALLSGKINPSTKIGVIISGGNVDGETMAAILTS